MRFTAWSVLMGFLRGSAAVAATWQHMQALSANRRRGEDGKRG